MAIIKKTAANANVSAANVSGLAEMVKSLVSGFNAMNLAEKGNTELLGKLSQQIMVLSRNISILEKSQQSLETRVSDGIASFLRYQKGTTTPASTPASTGKAGRPPKWVSLAQAEKLDMEIARAFVKDLLAAAAAGDTEDDIDLIETASQYFGKPVSDQFISAVAHKVFPEE